MATAGFKTTSLKHTELKSNISAPVTALTFFDKFYICAGEGSYLKVFHIEKSLLIKSKKIFCHASIHNLKVITALGSENSTVYAVLGGKSIRLVKVSRHGADIELLCDEKRFNSWIWDAIPLETDNIGHFERNSYFIALVSSQNNVFLWNWKQNEIMNIVYCTDQCILYSASFWGQSFSTLTVAVGTVFNEVLIWKPYDDNAIVHRENHVTRRVDKRLRGHEGVIFDVVFRNDGQQLLSVSDDRSIRMWCLDDSTCLHVFYGHKARVWTVAFFSNHFVSIGEDATCILWTIDGSIAKKFKGHRGKSIWSLAVDEESQRIATGGGDGGIRLWSASDVLSKQFHSSSDISLPDDVIGELSNHDDDDYPRTIRLLNANEILVLTNNGCFVHHKAKERSWDVIFRDKKYSSYCCVDVDRDLRLAVFGSLHGTVKLVQIDSFVSTEIEAFDAKVFSIFTLSTSRISTDVSERYLVACGPEGRIFVWTIFINDKSIQLKEKGRFQLPYCRQRWAAAVDILDVPRFPVKCAHIEFALVVGDRRGSLHVFYKAKRNSGIECEGPTQSLLSTHGKTGVTSVTIAGKYIYTTGKDGFYRKFLIDDQLLLQQMDQNRVCKGMDWIEGIEVSSNDILVYGFYMQSYFAIWSSSSNEMLLKISCGGGYRSWDLFMPSLGDHSCSFVYLKGPIIKSCFVPIIRNQLIVKEGLHGREIKCIKVLGKIKVNGELRLLFASGGEDTVVYFATYSLERNHIERIFSLDNHIGSVKSIYFITEGSAFDHKRTATDEIQHNTPYLLFTCGSRTSLKCTRVYFQDDGHVNSSLLAEIGTPLNSAKQYKSKMLDSSCDADDLRFLSMAVFPASSPIEGQQMTPHLYCIVAACSDANIRIYGFSSSSREVQLLTSSSFHARCVQIVRHFSILIGSHVHHFVLSGGTDGRIALWDITDVVQQFAERNSSNDNQDCNNDDDDGDDDLRDFEGVDQNINTWPRLGECSCKEQEEHQEPKQVFTEASKQINSKLQCRNPTSRQIKSSNYHLSSRLHSQAMFDELKMEPLHIFNSNQSGIHSIEIVESNKDSSFLLASGGDDNAIFLSKFKIDFSNNMPLFNLIWSDKHIFAHHSTITALRFLSEDVLVSSSIDQRVKIWQPLQDSSSSWENTFSCFTDIADVSDLECFHHLASIFVLISGVGVEVKEFRSN